MKDALRYPSALLGAAAMLSASADAPSLEAGIRIIVVR
jgi:hypothetical protein